MMAEFLVLQHETLVVCTWIQRCCNVLLNADELIACYFMYAMPILGPNCVYALKHKCDASSAP
jgi:hypothetical protein